MSSSSTSAQATRGPKQAQSTPSMNRSEIRARRSTARRVLTSGWCQEASTSTRLGDLEGVREVERDPRPAPVSLPLTTASKLSRVVPMVAGSSGASPSFVER